jgi:hypothetical protein
MDQDAASDNAAVNISGRAVWPNYHHLTIHRSVLPLQQKSSVGGSLTGVSRLA